ncbi:MAG: acyltransferase domain-containing protein [Myxococcales bacterium]|nr:acyltransferase domain-containing protein [Myxococcales bacterium]
MRSLRDRTAGSSGPPAPPSDVVAVLGLSVRSERRFEEDEVFDRALFGLDPEELRALGAVIPHLLEVAYEALESSGVAMHAMHAMQVGIWISMPQQRDWTGGEATRVAEVLGLVGPAVMLVDTGVGVSSALHAARCALRAGDVDVALAMGIAGDDGVGAVVLGGRDRAREEGWRVSSSLLATAAGPPSDDGVVALAQSRACRSLTPTEMDAADLVQLARVLAASDEASPTLATARGDAATVAVVVEPPKQPDAALLGEQQAPPFLGLSARSRASLRAIVRAATQVMATDDDLDALCSDAAARVGWEHRVAVPSGLGAKEVQQRLSLWLSRGEGAAASVIEEPTRLAFVASPTGLPPKGSLDALYAAEPAFRAALYRCDRILEPLMEPPLITSLFRSDEGALEGDAVFADAVTVAVAWSLAQVLAHHGVRPDAVLGCGLGEVSAAAITGHVSVESALSLAVERGLLLATLDDEVSRIVVHAGEDATRALLQGSSDVDLVALPTSDQCVVGGRAEGVAELGARAREAGHRVVTVEAHAAQTPLVDRLLDAFGRSAAAAPVQEPAGPMLLSAAAAAVVTGAPTESHWRASLRSTMQLAAGLRLLQDARIGAFVELTPVPGLAEVGSTVLSEPDLRWVCPVGETEQHLADVLTELWVGGVEVNHRGARRPRGSAVLRTYAWDRRSIDAEASDEAPMGPMIIRADSASSSEDRLPSELEWMTKRELPEHERADTLVPPEQVLPDTLFEADVDLLTQEPRAAVSRHGSLRPAAPSEGSPGALRAGAEPPRIVELEDGAYSNDPAVTSPRPPKEKTTPTGVTPGRRLNPESAPPPPPPLPPALSATVRSTVDPPVVKDPDHAPIPMMPEDDEEEEELEDIDVDAYAGVTRPLAEAEAHADAEVTWVEGWAPYPIQPRGPSKGLDTFVVLADRNGLGDEVCRALAERGHPTLKVHHESHGSDADALYVPDPAAEGAWTMVVDALGTMYGGVRVLHMWSLDLEDSAWSNPGPGWASLLRLAKDLHRYGLAVRIQVVTRGAVHEPHRASAYSAGALWGAGRLVSVEVPEVFGGLVDLDPEGSADADVLVEHLLAGDVMQGSGHEVAFRGGERLRRRVDSGRIPHVADGGLPRGSWLLGGDLDAPLVELATLLAEQGVSRIMMVSRAAPQPHVLQGVLELQRRGVMCIVLRADVSAPGGRSHLARRLGDEQIAAVVVRAAAAPILLKDLEPGEAAIRWSSTIAAARALEEIAGPHTPLWMWAEGRAMEPEAGSGLAAVTGAALEAAARARLAEGHPTTMIHAAPAGALRPGQMVRLVGRLGPVGGVFGVWNR